MTTPHSHKQGDWSSDTYSTNASFVYSAAFAAPALALLQPLSPSSHVLDLGCGSGELTIQIANMLNEEGRVVGADISEDMIRKARELTALEESKEGTEGRKGKASLEWFVLEGNRVNEVLKMGREGEFDAVFTSAALHWMKSDPPRVARNARELLKDGGKFCGEFGGFLNCGGVRASLYEALRKRAIDPVPLDPWFWPTPAHYRGLLETAGFRVDSCELVPRLTPLPTGLAGWLQTFAMSFFEPLTATEKEEVIREVCDKLEVDMKHETGWEIMYTRLRFSATRV